MFIPKSFETGKIKTIKNAIFYKKKIFSVSKLTGNIPVRLQFFAEPSFMYRVVSCRLYKTESYFPIGHTMVGHNEIRIVSKKAISNRFRCWLLLEWRGINIIERLARRGSGAESAHRPRVLYIQNVISVLIIYRRGATRRPTPNGGRHAMSTEIKLMLRTFRMLSLHSTYVQ